MRATLKRVKDELRRRMHLPIPEQGKWLQQVTTGFFAYHAVPTNSRALMAFRHHISVLWKRTLSRRSQKATLTWERMLRLVKAWLPPPAHPSPLARAALRRPTPEVGAECVNGACSDLCGGCAAMRIPTANRIDGLRSFRSAPWVAQTGQNRKASTAAEIAS